MTFEEFVVNASAYQRENPSQRLGQATFNYLHMVRPDLANHIRAEIIDPFYADEMLTEFLDYVKENWW